MLIAAGYGPSGSRTPRRWWVRSVYQSLAVMIGVWCWVLIRPNRPVGWDLCHKTAPIVSKPVL